MYEDLRSTSGSRHASWEQAATMMLALLPKLEALFAEREVWGLVSHHRLCLLSQRDFRGRRHASVSTDFRGYTISYLAPHDETEVSETVATESEAVARLAAAVEQSQGWPDRRWPDPGSPP